MSPITYEMYEVKNKELLKQVKRYSDIFRMLGFVTFEQGKNYTLASLSNEGALRTDFTKDGKNTVFKLENLSQKVRMTTNYETVGKNTEFYVERLNEQIIINCFTNPATNFPCISITIENKEKDLRNTMLITANSFSISSREGNQNKDLYYTDLSNFTLYQNPPYLIASYFDSMNDYDISYKKGIEIRRYKDKKGFYLETKHQCNGVPTFRDISIPLNTKKDAASYALELMESEEVRKYIRKTFATLNISLVGFSNYIQEYNIVNNIFKNEIESELYRIYCGVQKRLHEMTNSVRIEQLLEEMTFQKSKVKTLKNKA